MPLNNLNFFESLIDERGHILNVGYVSGRDSKYFLDKGYQVTSIVTSMDGVNFYDEKSGDFNKKSNLSFISMYM